MAFCQAPCDEIDARSIGEHADAVLGDAILMVRVDATKRDGLLAFSDFLEKSCPFEDTIISMAVLNGHAAFASVLFERFLSGDCIRGFVSGFAQSEIGVAGIRMICCGNL